MGVLFIKTADRLCPLFLVLMNQSDNVPEQKRYSDELEKILGRRRFLLSADHESYFSNWYIPVVREILALKGFVPTLDWSVRKLKPRVAKPLVKEALQTLVRLKMIVKKGDAWAQSQEHLTTPTEITSDLVHKYHNEMLQLSQQALTMPAVQRDVSAMTMSLSPKQFDWLKQRVIDFRDEIQQELQGMNEAPTLVAQLNIQVFPVTES